MTFQHTFLFVCRRSIIDEYLQPEHLNLPVTGPVAAELGISPTWMNLNIVGRSSVSASDAIRSVEQTNSNITLICLILEGVEKCSAVLGAGFQPALIEVLYPLLVKADSQNARVSRCALLALRGIARSCGAANVADLLRRNADYIVDAVALRLRHVGRYPEAPSVLGVVLRHGTVDVLPLFHDVILEVSSYRFIIIFVVIIKDHSFLQLIFFPYSAVQFPKFHGSPRQIFHIQGGSKKVSLLIFAITLSTASQFS